LTVQSTGPNEALAVSAANGRAALRNVQNDRCTIWNITSREAGPSWDLDPRDSARFSHDGKSLAIWQRWNNASTIQLWNAETGQLIEERDLAPDALSVLDVAFSPRTHHLAAALQFWNIAVFDLDRLTWKVYPFVQGGQSCATAITYSAQGDLLAAGLQEGDIMIFDVDQESGGLKVRSRWNGHSLEVIAIALSPDGRVLVTAAGDGAVRFWDVATGQERVTLDISAKLLSFSPDGNRLAVVGPDDCVRVLDGGGQLPSPAY
jgi:WD40 repeat protein